MRTVGTLRAGAGASCCLWLFALAIGLAHALPLQLLPEVPGYIPVYIRHGDQPLEEINPGLAEAFHERSAHSKNVRQTHVDRMSGESDMLSSSEDDSIPMKNDGSFLIVPPVKPLAVNRLHMDGNDMFSERLHHRKTIEVPKNSVLKVAEISDEEERELESLVAEIEREETKPNDLYDTNDSNFLYSGQIRGEIGERRVAHEVRPAPKLAPVAAEGERWDANERGPIIYDRVPDDSAFKRDSDEEEYARQDDKESDESEPGFDTKGYEVRSDERISGLLAKE